MKSDRDKPVDAAKKEEKLLPGGPGKKHEVDYGQLTADALNRAFPADKKPEDT
jgi:hypothetical protein